MPPGPWPYDIYLGDGTGEGDVPPLYPGRPAWVDDLVGSLSECISELSQTGISLNAVDMLVSSYVQQVQSDEHWALVEKVYAVPDGEGRTRGQVVLAPMEHVRIMASCGYRLSLSKGAQPCTWQEGVMGRGMQYTFDAALAKSMQLVAPLRRCDHCKESAAFRCECNEAFCSRRCHIAEWTQHRGICRMVKENNEFAYVVNRVWWNWRLGGRPGRR